MNAPDKQYLLQQVKSPTSLRFFFISNGQRAVIKVIEYCFLQELSGKAIYNLGFGDYDLESDEVLDNTNTNNGDTYKVFNTVLSTVPIFFENFSDGILMVQSSDGQLEFTQQCKLTCKKNCIDTCKNYNRRMGIYRAYIDKHYELLCLEYSFLGGLQELGKHIIVEPYERLKIYDAVFLFRKTNNFTL